MNQYLDNIKSSIRRDIHADVSSLYMNPEAVCSAFLYLAHYREQSAKHPEVAEGDSCAGEGVGKGNIAEYARQHGDQHTDRH